MLDPADYPEVLQLHQKVQELQLEFRKVEAVFSMPEENYIAIEMKTGSEVFVVPVVDEYEDFAQEKPSMALHLILTECETFEEAEDYLVWAKEVELNASNEKARQAWLHLRDVVPQIRKLLGNNIQPISAFNYELNTGAAKLLREIDLRN
ncbi:MAG: hypothetical protein CMO01_20315 [Thalassobius sp.]|nr:hypothetical protein [Thalassovita sp.]